MSQADLITHKYVQEVTLGVTPTSPALTKINVVSSSIDANISTTVSNQITPNRANTSLVRTEGSTGGDLGIEWSYAAYDDFVEGALGGDFSTAVSLTATDISASSTDNSINSVAAAFNTTNILPGHWIKISGFTGAGATANNGIAKVVSITTSKIIVSGLTLVTDAAGESVTIKGKSVRNGTTRKSYTIEKEFSDLSNVFAVHKGCVVNGMSINAAVGSIVSGSFTFAGTTTSYPATTSGTGSEIAATANQSYDPTDSIGTVWIDGVASTTCIRSLNLTTSNNTRNQNCLGSLYPSGVSLGTLDVTAQAEMYFNDTALLNKFIAGTPVSISYSFSDIDGNYLVIDMPEVYFSSGNVSGISKNSDTMNSFGLTAVYNETAGYAIQMSSLAA